MNVLWPILLLYSTNIFDTDKTSDLKFHVLYIKYRYVLSCVVITIMELNPKTLQTPYETELL